MNPRSALVTGAASGIGAEVARRLDRRGYQVLAVGRTAERASQAAKTIGGDSIGVSCDLADPADVATLCSRIADEWSHSLEIVVCNAGIIVPGDVAEITPEAIDTQLSVMLTSPIHLMRAALPGFIARDRGHLVATVSMGGIIALPTSATYSAAKAGLRAFLAAVNAEVSGTNVDVSGLYPSAVDTPMLRREAVEGGSALNFLGSVLSVERVADAYERALDSGTLEIYIPYSDSLTTRLIATKPALLPKFLPLLNRIGERGRAKYVASTGQ
jgi:short-subunit dehydrogenase